MRFVTLADHAYADKPVFGQYACAGPAGAVLRVGDEVEVTEKITRPETPGSESSMSPAITPIITDDMQSSAGPMTA